LRAGPGAQNYYTREFKEAIRIAAEQHGADGEGLDGIVGYMRMLASEEKATFASLIRATMPTEMNVREQPKPETEEEVRAALLSFGIRPEQLSGLRFYDREQKLIELMADDVTDTDTNDTNGSAPSAGSNGKGPGSS